MIKNTNTNLSKILLKMIESFNKASDEGEDLYAISWGFEEGYLISFNDCKTIIDYISSLENAVTKNK